MPSLRTTTTSYSIGQLRRIFGVTARALRFYDQIGLVEPGREGLQRVYSRGDYQRIRVITNARKAGLSIEHIRKLLSLYDPTDRGAAQAGNAIELLRQRISELDAQRSFAATKLAELELHLERVRPPALTVTEGRFGRGSGTHVSNEFTLREAR